MFQRCAIWNADLMESVIQASADATQVGQDLVVNNYLVIPDVKNMGNVGMELVCARRVGTDVTARYVRL